jgi:aminoglycoside phosphotransferase (APT) family kinase protein
MCPGFFPVHAAETTSRLATPGSTSQNAGMDPTALTPLDGGWSGETFVAEVAGERSVVRIYAGPSHRGDNAHDVDAALLRLVRGLVPVPEVLEVRRADPATDMPALLVTTFLPGVRADLLLPELDDERLVVLGARLGRILADLAGMPMLRAGPFVDGDLTIGSFALDGQSIDGLPAFVSGHEEALSHWTQGELEGLREVAVDAQALLDTVGRSCLVHSDVNPKNLLVDPDTLEVTGLLDWEFAHAGHPYTDLGNLLRFDRQPAFVGAVLDAYVARHGGAPGEALDLARAADLWALVDLAGRRGQNPVADRAHDLLLAIARARDPSVTG